MPIVIVCDDTISMIIKSFDGKRIIDIVDKFLHKFFSTIEAPYLHYISLFRRNDQFGSSLLPFRKDYKFLLDQFQREISKNIRNQIHGEFRYFEVVKYCDSELRKLFGCDTPHLIIILSDGGKVFEGIKAGSDEYTLDDKFRSIVHSISFTDHMNEALKSLSEQTGGVSLCTDYKDCNDSDEIIDKVWKKFRKHALHLWHSDAVFSFGHMKTDVKLFPFIDLNYSNDIKYCYEKSDNNDVEKTKLLVDIYGYLSLADLNYPCSTSDHFIIYDNHVNVCDDDGGVVDGEVETEELNLCSSSFIHLLNNGLLATKTAAMCCIKYRNDDYVRYGFVRNFFTGENKHSLKLCLFPKDYLGLPWIGKFRDLSPCSDFPDIYNTAESKSPFPVKLTGDCSYKTNNDDSYQYTTWVSSSNALVNDFSKIVRICKRLPERKSIFFKEINRFRETALTIGSRGLLNQLCSMLQKEGTAITNVDAQAVIRHVIECLTNNPHNQLMDFK